MCYATVDIASPCPIRFHENFGQVNGSILIFVDVFACLLFVERDQPLPHQRIILLDLYRGFVGFGGFVILVLFL